MADPFIPPKTAEMLSQPFAPGTRHKAAMDIALPLIGNGMPAETVFQTLQTKFYPGLSEKEIRDVVSWANGRGNPARAGSGFVYRRPLIGSPAPSKAKSPVEHANWWLNGASVELEAFRELSQLRIPESKREALQFAMEMLWTGSENLNIVCNFLEEDGKARPNGPGRILSRDKWCEYLHQKGVPESRAGAWIRPNPCQQAGSGTAGAITDSDIVAWKYLLIESDTLPLKTQLALFSKLKLPIVAVVKSGGISAHSWVFINAKDAATFTEIASRILTALNPFGIDQCNKNPSRLSRLPCAKRVIGGVDGGEQTLLWLNPGRKSLTPEGLEDFEASLLLPAVEEKPFKALILESIDRYEYLIANRGKLGVPTGLPTLQKTMGGWKPATLNVIAANTGGGKTTLALNLMNTALRDGIGVALFSMEMTKEDIVDMMFCVNGKIDRNRFNTGEFTERDIQQIVVESAWMKDLPLWIDDSSMITVEQIRVQVLGLRKENRIGLAVVDYAQLVTPGNDRDSRELQVAAVSRGLRVLAKDAKIPLIVLSQLNDEGKIRESRVLAHEAANVFVLEKNNSGMTLHVMKGRKIPSQPIPIYFDAVHCLMGEVERQKIDDADVPRTYVPD